MRYRQLGRTGLQVSRLALGTVSLGAAYGIPVPGEFGRPAEADAIRILEYAVDSGINLFDTAPAYGDSEQLIGKALKNRPDCCIATKIAIPLDAAGRPLGGNALRHNVVESLEASLCALQRDCLDIVQVHNATIEVIHRGELAATP